MRCRHCRRRRRRRRRCHRRRHLEQIMARIRRGGERTAGRTGFSWVGLGWVGITSAIDLITPCGPRCLLVPVSRAVSLSLSLSLPPSLFLPPPPLSPFLPFSLPFSFSIFLSSFSHYRLSLVLRQPSRIRRHPRILSLSIFSLTPPSPTLSLSLSLSFSSFSSTVPCVPRAERASEGACHLLASSLAIASTCVSGLFACFLSPFRSYFLASASSSHARCSFRDASLFIFFLPFSPSVSTCGALRPSNVPFFFSSQPPRVDLRRSLFLFIKRDAYA